MKQRQTETVKASKKAKVVFVIVEKGDGMDRRVVVAAAAMRAIVGGIFFVRLKVAVT